MATRDMSDSPDSASEAILRVQREVLLKLGAELLASQRAALSGVQAEMDQASCELSEQLASWRRRTIGVISFSTGLLVPWLVLLAVLGGATLFIGTKARIAWTDYRAAQAAAERLRAHGALTVLRDGQLYVRVDPGSLAQGKRGNWYARTVSVEFREDDPSSEP